MPGNTVVIGGGSGFIGTTLNRMLTKLGFNVLVVSRQPGLNSITWHELQAKGLPHTCVAVVNLAGQNILDPTRRWTPGFKQNVWASRVDTTKSLAVAIRRATQPPKVFVTMSGVAFYQPSATKEYTEDSPGGDFDFLSKLCAEWEAAAELPQDLGVRHVIIRTGVVLGSYGGMIKHMFWPFFFCLGGPTGSGKQFMPWIHLDDVAGLFTFAIQNEHVTGVLNAVAPHIVTNEEFAKSFGRAMWRPAFLSMPTFFLNLAFSEERAKIMIEGQKVIPKRTQELGYKYKYPDIDSACRDCAQLKLLVDRMVD